MKDAIIIIIIIIIILKYYIADLSCILLHNF